MPLKKSAPILLFSFFLFLLTVCKGEEPTYSLTISPLITDTIPETDTTEKIFEKVEIEAAFPGGEKTWRTYLERSLNPATPVNNGAPAGVYTVVVQFIVDKNGNISNVNALTTHGYGMETEVMRVIKKGPKWEPAIQYGRSVKAYRKQPVTFMVTEEKRKNKKNKS